MCLTSLMDSGCVHFSSSSKQKIKESKNHYKKRTKKEKNLDSEENRTKTYFFFSGSFENSNFWERRFLQREKKESNLRNVTFIKIFLKCILFITKFFFMLSEGLKTTLERIFGKRRQRFFVFHFFMWGPWRQSLERKKRCSSFPFVLMWVGFYWCEKAQRIKQSHILLQLYFVKIGAVSFLLSFWRFGWGKRKQETALSGIGLFPCLTTCLSFSPLSLKIWMWEEEQSLRSLSPLTTSVHSVTTLLCLSPSTSPSLSEDLDVGGRKQEPTLLLSISPSLFEDLDVEESKNPFF